jgi:hypothetical protein
MKPRGYSLEYELCCRCSFPCSESAGCGGSPSQAKAWTDRANTDFQNDGNVAVYSKAVLEDAPRLVRGMAVHGIESGVPDGQRDDFAIVYQGEAT